jgi:hypothetical protein
VSDLLRSRVLFTAKIEPENATETPLFGYLNLYE